MEDNRRPGRPPEAMDRIDRDRLLSLMKYYPSRLEAASDLGVSESSLQRYIDAEFECSFECLRERYFARTRVQIKRKQIKVALSGDVTMLIYTGKIYLGQVEPKEPIDESSEEYARPESMRGDEE